MSDLDMNGDPMFLENAVLTATCYHCSVTAMVVSSLFKVIPIEYESATGRCEVTFSLDRTLLVDSAEDLFRLHPVTTLRLKVRASAPGFLIGFPLLTYRSSTIGPGREFWITFLTNPDRTGAHFAIKQGGVTAQFVD